MPNICSLHFDRYPAPCPPPRGPGALEVPPHPRRERRAAPKTAANRRDPPARQHRPDSRAHLCVKLKGRFVSLAAAPRGRLFAVRAAKFAQRPAGQRGHFFCKAEAYKRSLRKRPKLAQAAQLAILRDHLKGVQRSVPLTLAVDATTSPTISPYSPSASAKIRMRIMPTKRRGC